MKSILMLFFASDGRLAGLPENCGGVMRLLQIAGHDDVPCCPVFALRFDGLKNVIQSPG